MRKGQKYPGTSFYGDNFLSEYEIHRMNLRGNDLFGLCGQI